MSSDHKPHRDKYSESAIKMNVVDFAWQVIEMQRTIEVQEADLARLRQTERDYDELLASSRRHGEVMMGNLLELCMTPGVVDALRANASPEGEQT